MTQVPQLRVENRGAQRWMIADNPARLNAYTAAMWQALPGLIHEAEEDPSVRVLILTGAGEKAFSAGADISEFDTQRSGEQARRYDDFNNSAFGSLANCSKPTIAMIHGICFGGGLELAICCDMRLAAETARFSIPAAKLGIGYNARWIKPLLSVVSPATAKEMLFTARHYDAGAALRIGLVNAVYPAAQLAEATQDVANELATNAPLSIRAAKAAIDALAHPSKGVDLTDIDALVHACFESDDYAEGRRAFAEKRKPAFKGR
ncbi:MAG: enoyl-CoA hydratase [Hyphomicrobiaceae bacterium]